MGTSAAYELRARLRPLALNERVRDCGRKPVTPVPAVVVREYEGEARRAWWSGLVRCGRQHSCPVCAERRAAERAEELDRMMANDPDGRWQMVTLTLSHQAGQRLKETLDALMRALRRVRSRRAVREIFARRVSASARAVEVTFGGNGWHPHVHLILRTEEWTPQERSTLVAEWLREVPGLPSRAIVWSTPIECWQKKRAVYLSKLGAEVAGIGKAAKNGNAHPFQLAERALNDSRAAFYWREYQSAMHGRRLLELDERAKRLAGEKPLSKLVREWVVNVFAEEFHAIAGFERARPTLFWDLIQTTGADPPAEFRAKVDELTGRLAAQSKAA